MAISPYVAELRRHVGSNLLLLPSVMGVIYDAQSRVLLVRQTADGRWSTPGGVLEPEETPAAAVVREVREETGLEVSIVRLLGVFGGPSFVVRGRILSMNRRISLSRTATALAGGALALVLVSCGDPTGPRYDIAISLYEDSVWATRSATEVKVSLHVQISNQDARPVYLTPCLHVLERAQGSSWQRIRVSPCPLGQIVSLELTSGESTLLTLEYRAPVTDQVWPVVGAAGEYRAVISLTTIPFNRSGLTPTLLSLSSRATPRFQIRERTVIVSRESSRFIHPAFRKRVEERRRCHSPPYDSQSSASLAAER